MNRLLTVACLLVTALWGCAAPSLHPLYAPQTLVQDSGLVGEWATEGPTVTRIVISEAGGGKYGGELTVHHDGQLKTGLSLEVCLTDIGRDRYADLFLAVPDRERLVAKYGFLALPVHQFMMVKREGDALRAWTFNADWLRQAGSEHAFACEVLPIGGHEVPVITAESGTLREFLGKHAQDPGALSAPMIFHRVGREPRADSASAGPDAHS